MGEDGNHTPSPLYEIGRNAVNTNSSHEYYSEIDMAKVLTFTAYLLVIISIYSIDILGHIAPAIPGQPAVSFKCNAPHHRHVCDTPEVLLASSISK